MSLPQNIPNMLYPGGFDSSGMISMLLSQTGTAAPTKSILKKTIGDTDPVIARTGVGTYTITLTGAFPSGKVVAPGNVINAVTGAMFSIVRTSDNVLTLTTAVGGAAADALLSNTPIIIYVKR